MPRRGGALDDIAAALPTFEEAEQASLRQKGMRDPLPGCPLMVQRHPGAEPEEIDPGAWRGQGLAQPVSGLPPDCPVTPLGKDGATCYLLDTMGAVAELDAKSSGKGPIGYIFAGRSRYLEWAFPRFGKAPRSGGKPSVNGWDADDARQTLVDACAFAGVFQMEDQVRGRGAWPAEDGGLIYHAGDAIWIDGRWRAPGAHGRHIYPARGAIGRPSPRAHRGGAGSSGDYLLELLRTFHWDRGELDARLMLGWLMTAKMGGALHRRPVVFVVGAEGSGKSTLHGVLRATMNRALIQSSNTTQAGIYQQLRQDSVAIMVDEMEAKEDTRTVDRILELARICYSGDRMQRGGKDGVGREFTLSSSFLGSSISKPATDAQDDSRMAVLMLRKREQAGGRLVLDVPTLEGIGRDLLRRIFDHWGRWEAIVEPFRALMIELGHTDRACDTFAPLAAAAHLALSDDLPTAIELEPWREWLAPADLAEVATREDTWRRCFWHMLEAQPDSLRTWHHKSLGSAIAAFQANDVELGELEKVAAVCGVAISFPRGAEQTIAHARLFVPFKSPPLHALFEGTPWAGRLGAPGPWGGVLRQAPREVWSVSVCDKALNRSAKGLMLGLRAILASED